MPKPKTPPVCACPFCGQVVETSGKKFKNSKDAEKWAIVQCSCADAVAHVDKALLLEKAKEDIDELFGGEDKQQNPAAREILLLAAHMISDGAIESCQIKLNYGTKAGVKYGSKSTLNISRTDTETSVRTI